MVLVKLFGIMDLLSAFLLTFLKYGIGESIAYIFIFYLLAKGLFFFGDFNSVVDLVIALFIFLAAQGIFVFVTWILVLYLLQKAFFSLVG